MFDGPMGADNPTMQHMQGTPSSGHSPQLQQNFEYQVANEPHDRMQEEYYGDYGVAPPMFNAPPHAFTQPTVDLLTAAGLPQTAQAGPFALPQSFPIPQAPHMQSANAMPYHQGAADLIITLPPDTDAAAWDKIFQGYGGRLA